MLDWTNADTQDALTLSIYFGVLRLFDQAERYTVGFWYQRRRATGGGVVMEVDNRKRYGRGTTLSMTGASGDNLSVTHNLVISSTSPSIGLDTTYSFLVTWDDHEGLNIYRNGVSWHTDPTFQETPNIPADTGFSIGADPAATLPGPPGYLGNVAIWPGIRMNSVDAVRWNDGIMPHYNSCRFFYRGTSVPGRDEHSHLIPDCFQIGTGWFRYPINFFDNIWQASDPSDLYNDLHGELPHEEMVVLAGEELNRRRLVRQNLQVAVKTEFYARELMQDLQVTHKGGLEYSGKGFGYEGEPERLVRIDGIALRPGDRAIELSMRDMKRQALSYYNSFRSPFTATERQDGLFRLAPPHVAKKTTRDSFAWGLSGDDLYHEFGIDQEPTTPTGILVESRKRNYIDNPAFKHGMTGWVDASGGGGGGNVYPSGGGLKIFRPVRLHSNPGTYGATSGYTMVTAVDPNDPVVHDDLTSIIARGSGGGVEVGYDIDTNFGEQFLTVVSVKMWCRIKRSSSATNEFRHVLELNAAQQNGAWVPYSTSFATYSRDFTSTRPGGGNWVEDDFRDSTFAMIVETPPSAPATEITSIWLEVEFEGESVPKLFHRSVTQKAGWIGAGATPATDFGALSQYIVGAGHGINMNLSWFHYDEDRVSMQFAVERHNDGYFLEALSGGWNHEIVYLDVPLSADEVERFVLPAVLDGDLNYTITFYARSVAYQANWIHHVQFEEGLFATSPIVSETGNDTVREGSVVVLRNPDGLMLPSGAATVAFEFVPEWAQDEADLDKILARLSHDASNYIELYWDQSESELRCNWVHEGNDHISLLSGLTWEREEVLQLAFRWLADGDLGVTSAQGQLFAKIGSGSWQEAEPAVFDHDLVPASESLYYVGSSGTIDEYNAADGLIRYQHCYPEALPFEEIQALLGEVA